MKFWDTELGKIASNLAHDHSNAFLLCHIKIKDLLESDSLSEEERVKLEYVKDKLKRMTTAVDNAYNKLKQIHDANEQMDNSVQATDSITNKDL